MASIPETGGCLGPPRLAPGDGLEGKIAEEEEARDGARRALPRLQSESPQSAPAGGPNSGREAQASAREAERPAPMPAGVGPASLRGTCGASAVHAAWASGVRPCCAAAPPGSSCRPGSDSHGGGADPGREQAALSGAAIFSGSCSPSRTDRTS